MQKPPLIEVKNLYKRFRSGEGEIDVLKDVNLTIQSGEMLAIMGQSGSGKTTLMNILGCLDRASSGSYKIRGKSTSDMLPDELAKLRREHFGFIFQRYHLLGDLSAVGNVEIPSIYANYPLKQREQRAKELLGKLGLGERVEHKPSQLSGGQQQRVSIARALMNGGEIIFADEPTGALDSKSGEDVMRILEELNKEGHTIVIVTHDPNIAKKTNRIIEIKDGVIISDKGVSPEEVRMDAPNADSIVSVGDIKGSVGRFQEAFKMAIRTMIAHKMRTFLTMLGIIIGIASVVSVVALGEGSRQKILKDISSMGTNTINIYPGSGFGDRAAKKVDTLTIADALFLSQQEFVDSVTPTVRASAIAKYKNKSVNAQVEGVGVDYFKVKGVNIEYGMVFDERLLMEYAQVAVIDANAKKELFGDNINPVGKVILLGKTPIRIIGVTKKADNSFMFSEGLTVWSPYTTVMGRITGQVNLGSITVRIKDRVPSKLAEQNIKKMLTTRHGADDFYVSNLDSIKKTIESTTATMTLLISMIAAISLVVGGIGVMNIMLVSVTERTAEIGVRMAVGARQGDIMKQFLIEAVTVCIIGGIFGVLLALAIGFLFSYMGSSFEMLFSLSSIVWAFICSSLIGIVFGFVPAKNAAKLDPVVALNKE